MPKNTPPTPLMIFIQEYRKGARNQNSFFGSSHAALQSVPDLFNTRGKRLESKLERTLLNLKWATKDDNKLLPTPITPPDFKEGLLNYQQDIDTVNKLYWGFQSIGGEVGRAHLIFKFQNPSIDDIRKRLEEETGPPAQETLKELIKIDEQRLETTSILQPPL